MRCTGLIKKSWNRNLEFGAVGHVEDDEAELSDDDVTDLDLCFKFPGPDVPNIEARESYECFRALEGKSAA